MLKDYNLKRLELMGRSLADALSRGGMSSKAVVVGPYAPPVEKVAREYIRVIRVLLPKDRSLKSNKRVLAETVENFEKARKYVGHIHLDVDPV